MRTTFSILFYINRSKDNNGLVPVICRITVNGGIAQFSCKLKVPMNLWDPHAGRVIGKSTVANNANSILDGIRARIVTVYHQLASMGLTKSANKIKEMTIGREPGKVTLLELLDKQTEIIASRVGKDRSMATLSKYRIVRRHVGEFIAKTYHEKDFPVEDLNEAFIRKYCIYLREDVGVSQSSVWVYQMPLRTVVTAAFNDGIITRNPFHNFHVSPDVKKRDFLTEGQLKFLIRFPLKGHLDFVRDIFLFCCFTGLSFIDFKNLKPADIVELNGSRWIISKRQKTKVPYQAKLLSIPEKILNKYSPAEDGKPVFDVGGYTTVNKRLKKIGILSGISDNLTFHMARHTFATLALSKGMSMESLRSILGHTDIHTTQIYAKITSQKLEHDYSCLTDGTGEMW